MKRVWLLVLITAALIGCTDATRSSIASYGSEHTVTMYNGGVQVRQWTSTGKVTSMTDSDG